MKWLALLLVVLITGCGTVRNFSPVWNDERPTACNAAIYGGVRTDVAEMKAAARDLGRFPHPDSRVLANSSTLVCNAVDTPLSAVGDTLTLHRTIPATITRHVVESKLREREFWEEREIPTTNEQGVYVLQITSPPEPASSNSPPGPAPDPDHWAR